MGKRKQHGITYYQCDWTGLPMRSTNCYMPTWNGDKLVKHGSYAYWECVVAHVHELEKAGDLLDVEARRILEHVHPELSRRAQCIGTYKGAARDGAGVD